MCVKPEKKFLFRNHQDIERKKTTRVNCLRVQRKLLVRITNIEKKTKQKFVSSSV